MAKRKPRKKKQSKFKNFFSEVWTGLKKVPKIVFYGTFFACAILTPVSLMYVANNLYDINSTLIFIAAQQEKAAEAQGVMLNQKESELQLRGEDLGVQKVMATSWYSLAYDNCSRQPPQKEKGKHEESIGW